MSSVKKTIAALVFFHLAIIVFLLLYDERLNREIQKFHNGTTEIVEDRKNAFFAFAGFDAEEGREIHSTGESIVYKFKDEIKKNPFLDHFDSTVLLGQRLAFRGQNLEKSSGARLTYFPVDLQRKSTIDELIADNQELASRYTSLYNFPYYYETTPCTPASLFINYANISNTHKLILWKVALDVQEGNTSAALSLLRRDAIFWHMVLGQSQELITRLLAMNSVLKNCQLLSEILVYRPDAAALLSDNDPLLQPLSKSEKDLSASMRREFEFNLYSMKMMKRDLWQGRNAGSEGGSLNMFLAPMLKVNSSSNMLYEDFSRMAKIAALPASEFADEVEKLGHKKQPRFGCEILYNFTGKVIFGLADPTATYIKYIQKVHDLDGYISLANLQLRIQQHHVKDGELQDFLDKADPAFANPYTGKPMQWDREKRCIYFESLAKEGEESRRVELIMSSRSHCA